MSFQDSIRTVLMQKYADFNGRARRSEFWWFTLFSAIVQSIASMIDRAVLDAGAVGILGGIVWLALVVPSLAVGARRLHDTGRSGWWQLLALLPIVGVIVLIVWWAQDSHADNEYGTSPKGLTAAVPVA